MGFDIQNEFQGDEENYIHCCLFKYKELIAYARVAIQDNYARISRVLMKKQERSKGYGRQIVFWTETEALKNNINNVILHALESGLGFYENQGYITLGEKFVEESRNHYLLNKHLELND